AARRCGRRRARLPARRRRPRVLEQRSGSTAGTGCRVRRRNPDERSQRTGARAGRREHAAPARQATLRPRHIRVTGRRQVTKNEGPRRVDKPWGHELIWAHTDRYVGKILHVKAGHALSLQYHDLKDETMHLLRGRMRLHIGPSADELAVIELAEGESIR